MSPEESLAKFFVGFLAGALFMFVMLVIGHALK